MPRWCVQPTYIKNSDPQITQITRIRNRFRNSVPQIMQINADLKKMKDQRTYKIIDPQIKK